VTFVVQVTYQIIGVKVEGQTLPLKFAPPAAHKHAVCRKTKIRGVNDNSSGHTIKCLEMTAISQA
jgi:hypothetical protein